MKLTDLRQKAAVDPWGLVNVTIEELNEIAAELDALRTQLAQAYRAGALAAWRYDGWLAGDELDRKAAEWLAEQEEQH
jgi:hypothetical protein